MPSTQAGPTGCFATRGLMDVSSPMGLAHWLWGSLHQNEMIARWPELAQDQGKTDSPLLIAKITQNTTLAIQLSWDYGFGFGLADNLRQNATLMAEYPQGVQPYGVFWTVLNQAQYMRCIIETETLTEAFQTFTSEYGYDANFTLATMNRALSAWSYQEDISYANLDPAIYGDYPYTVIFPQFLTVLLPGGHVYFTNGLPDSDYTPHFQTQGSAQQVEPADNVSCASVYDCYKVAVAMTMGGSNMIIVPSAVVDSLAQEYNSQYACTYWEKQTRPCILMDFQTFLLLPSVYGPELVTSEVSHVSDWIRVMGSIPQGTSVTWGTRLQTSYNLVMQALANYSKSTGYDFTHLTRIAFDSRLPEALKGQLLQSGFPTPMQELIDSMANSTICNLNQGTCNFDRKAMAQHYADRLLAWLQVNGMFYENLPYFNNWLAYWEPQSEISKIPYTNSFQNYRAIMTQYAQVKVNLQQENSTQQPPVAQPPVTDPPMDPMNPIHPIITTSQVEEPIFITNPPTISTTTNQTDTATFIHPNLNATLAMLGSAAGLAGFTVQRRRRKTSKSSSIQIILPSPGLDLRLERLAQLSEP